MAVRRSTRKTIIIVGGGASGVLLAVQLLRDREADIRVALIEKREDVGRGLAYSATLAEHVLNVLPSRMSAYPDDPGHFFRWLVTKGAAKPNEPHVFVPRRLFGDYLGEVFEEIASRETPTGRLHRINDACVAVIPSALGVEARLASGASVVGHQAVLAVGHEEGARTCARHATRPWREEEQIPADETVLIMGTGLSMVDAWLSLEESGHRGRIVALSRRGLIAEAHNHHGKPRNLAAADVPLGAPHGKFVRWLRQRAAENAAAGGNWHDVMDSLRPHNQAIWQSWSVDARARFLRHSRAYWDIHRHRLPADVHGKLTAAIESGRVEVVAGRLVDAKRDAGRITASMRRRGTGELLSIEAARLYDCTGLSSDMSRSTNPAIRSLVEAGHARPDALRIGLDVDADCAVVGADGDPTPRLFALGPITRGAFFEIEAVPDIRQQADALAKRLAGQIETLAELERAIR